MTTPGAGKAWPATRALSRRALLASMAGATLTEGCRRSASGPGSGLVVGYLNNITHAQPLLGALSGDWARALGPGAALIAFPGGPAVMEAMNAGSVDAGFLGPSTAINAFVRSGGRRLRILLGVASGGASLVARSSLDMEGSRSLRGRTLSASLIGSMPDVSARAYLRAQGLAPVDRGGDVTLIPMTNAESLQLLRRGRLDACWAQEPWASRMVASAGCRRILDERELWPRGRFPTTVLAVSTRALAQKPAQVARLAALLEDDTARLLRDPAGTRARVGDALALALGKPLRAEVLADAWGRIELTADPQPEALGRLSDSMRAIGYLPKGSIDGLLAAPPLTRRSGARPEAG